LTRLRVPTLLLSGARTVATARTLVQRVRAALPHARHDVLPDMGHMGPVTHATAFNRRIADFLGQQARSSSAAQEVDECLPQACMPDLLPAHFLRTLLS
jgi:hypothetical protein